MSQKDNSIVSIIKQPVSEFIIDAGDLGLNKILECLSKDENLLTSLPFIKWFMLGKNIVSSIQFSHFLKKYSKFIGPIKKEINDDFWEQDFNEILNNKKTFEAVIEDTIMVLDRYQTITKAELLGPLFIKTFKDKVFSFDEYNQLIFSIELMHPHIGIKRLLEFYEYRLRVDSEPDDDKKRDIWEECCHYDFSPLVTSGLLILPSGGVQAGDLGGAYLNELGYRFCREIVSKIEI